MTQRRLWVTLFVVSIIVTLIGLGFAVYNYYVFDKPFMTTTTKGLLAAFFPVCDKWLPSAYPNQIRSKDKKEV